MSPPAPTYNLGAVAKDGRVNFTSASQLETAQRCLKRWHFSKVLRIPKVETDNKQRGKALHKEAADYFTVGSPGVLGPVLIRARHVLPTRLTHPQGKIEWSINPAYKAKDWPVFLSQPGTVHADGVPVVGDIDFLVPGFVRDYKFTTSISYAKTEHALVTDLQMNIYGLYDVRTHGVAQSQLELCYFDLKTKRVHEIVQQVRITRTREELEAFAAETLTPLMQRMKKVTRLPIAQVEFNTEACRDYGACDYLMICPEGQRACNTTALANSFAPAKEEPMMQNTQAPAYYQQPAHQQAVQAEKAQLQQQEAMPTFELYRKFRELNLGTPAIGGAVAQAVALFMAPASYGQQGLAYAGSGAPAGEVVNSHDQLVACYNRYATQATAITSPQTPPSQPGMPVASLYPPPAPQAQMQMAAPQQPQPQAQLDFNPQAQNQVQSPGLYQPQAHEIAPAQYAPAVQSPGLNPQPTAEPEKKKKGRPAKNTAVTMPPGAQVQAVAETVFQTAAAPVVTAHTQLAKAASQSDVTLYVDCLPVGENVASLQSYVQFMLDKLAEKEGVLDVRFTGGQGPLAFGGWRGALTAFVRANPPTPGSYALDTRGNEAGEIIATALWGMCRVVRGLR